jgi:hypothetical protein
MHEELENFEKNQVWTLVDPLKDVNVIETKWVFKNKHENDGEVEEQDSPCSSRVQSGRRSRL